jgi:DNA-binding NarL/FixJ family response regulator
VVIDQTVLVVSSHPVIEGVVRLAAEATLDICRILTTSDAQSLGELIESEHPDVIVVDIDQSATSGLDGVRAAREASPDVLIIVLSEQADGHFVLEAIRLRVNAFLRKPQGLRDVPAALAAVLAGDRIFAPDLERTAVDALGTFARRARAGSAVGASLSPREREILPLLADGLTMQQISRRLGISPRTVETHVSKLYRKLSVHTRLQAVSRAASLGLIELR